MDYDSITFCSLSDNEMFDITGGWSLKSIVSTVVGVCAGVATGVTCGAATFSFLTGGSLGLCTIPAAVVGVIVGIGAGAVGYALGKEAGADAYDAVVGLFR